MKWYNPQNEPFKISGFAFFEKDKVYRRMPLNPVDVLPEAVDGLSNHTSGGQIRFHASFKTLKIAFTRAAAFQGKDPHLALTNKAGFDLYFSKNGEDYKFFGVTKGYDANDRYYEYTFIDGDTEIEMDVLLNFPLYGTVDKVLIGLDDDAVIMPSQKKFDYNRNIVFYGGSIEQGACASRPGMCETNILSRWLGMQVFNLGFSGSGKAESEVASVISGIENTAAFVISTEGNCPDGEWIYKYLTNFINTYRQKHEETPIIIMPFARSGRDAFLERSAEVKKEKRLAQEKIVREFRDKGDKNIYLFNQEEYVEEEFEGISVWHEYTVDGTHKTDLGYMATAKALYKFLKTLGKFNI